MSGTLTVRIAAKRMLTPRIREFTLAAADGTALPAFTAGAHVNVDTPGGATRSYSLTGDPRRRDRYVIAVAREADGRGGSASLVDGAEPGDHLRISPPVNTFPLHRAARYLLVAGGVGITPLRAMYHDLVRRGADVRLLYLTRTPGDTAYRDELAADEAVRLHHSAHAGRLDLWPYLAEPDDDARIYCCGPPSLMDEVHALTMHWRPSRVHFEDFAGVSGTDGTSEPFRALWRPTGQVVDVPATATLLQALRDTGVEVPSSCESGTCGTCRLHRHGGEAEHRDLVLEPHERERYLMPCVSRAPGGATIEVGPVAQAQ
ncbi:PDR/VanB family oxidoreductase [Prauserella muralis]|nr:PDR/VanB family oxidoreductase [Prauserella muralis]TWE22509.1 phthalate 4,5-dioxygenase reductase subunit [Prauserella muralis]